MEPLKDDLEITEDVSSTAGGKEEKTETPQATQNLPPVEFPDDWTIEEDLSGLGEEQSETMRELFGSFEDRVSMRLPLNRESKKKKANAIALVHLDISQSSQPEKRNQERRSKKKKGTTFNIIVSIIVILGIVLFCKYILDAYRRS